MSYLTIFAALKTIAYILSFVFLSFIAGPTIIAGIDKSVDLSYAFTASEEENSSKNLLTFEYTIEETHSNHESIHFLQEHSGEGFSYNENNYQVVLDVVSPPPKNI